MGVPAAILISTALAAGAQGVSANQAAKKAEGAANEQKEQQKKLQADLAAQQASQETSMAADKARRDARRRQLALAAGGTGRQDTILTQSLGIIGAPGAAGKTLLGT